MSKLTHGAVGVAFVATLTLLSCPALAGEGDEIVVVVNARNPSTKITRTQLRSIYMGQTAFWHGVVPMKVVMRPVTSDASSVNIGRRERR